MLSTIVRWEGGNAKMALTIKSVRAEQLARELAEQTGDSLTDAVIVSLQRRLIGERRARALRSPLDDILSVAHGLPVLDHRAEDEILGFDEDGLSLT